MTSRSTLIFFVFLYLLIPPAPARAGVPSPDQFLLPGGDYPGGTAQSLDHLPDEPQKHVSAWSIRTGAKKGITEQVLREEIAAGPDAAILKGGFFAHWQRLLANFQEPAVLVDPDELAGIASTKPFLIIPEGALYGLSGSDFFKAGLAEYARSGGIILCFAQQAGTDFSALPVPDGSSIEASGWAEDFGPLFRASTVRSRHPVLAGVKKRTPDVETDGYLRSYPPRTTLLLSRADGRATLILYPYGSGWVVATTLFSGFSFGQGRLDGEEQGLIHGLISWAKARGHVYETAAGQRLTFHLPLTKRERNRAAAVRVVIMGPDRHKPISAQMLPLPAAINGSHALPYHFTVPRKTQPGIYRTEFLLLDRNGKAVSPRVESATGWFSIRQSAQPVRLSRPTQSLDRVAQTISVTPSARRAGGRVRMDLTVKSTRKEIKGLRLLVRVSGQKQYYTLKGDQATIPFRFSAGKTEDPIHYALYHNSGRLLIRGSVSLPRQRKKGVFPDRRSYSLGENALVTVSGMESGELTLIGLGKFENQMVAKGGSMKLEIPADLPAGTYAVRWVLQHMDESMHQGTFDITILGKRAVFLGTKLEERSTRKIYTGNAVIRFYSDHAFQGRLKFWLRRPDRAIVPLHEKTIDISTGNQTIPVSFSLKKNQGGIWSLLYSISTIPPRRIGIPAEPVLVAAGRAALDVGNAALLGITTMKPVYDEPSGPVTISSYLSGKGKARFELYLDGTRVKKERLVLSGTQAVSARLPDLGMGFHIVRAVLRAERTESSKEVPFTYGAMLPDLAVSMDVPALSGNLLPVSMTVINRGKKASPPCRIVLYESDHTGRRTTIHRSDMPALDPGARRTTTADWLLTKKAGARTLHAVADPDDRVIETDKQNNIATRDVRIPEVLLTVRPGKSTFTSIERISFSVIAVNLTSRRLGSQPVSLHLVDAKNATVKSDTLSMSGLRPGEEKRFDRSFSLSKPRNGSYQLTADMAGRTGRPSFSTGITILPTLALHGTLDGTSSLASSCTPFTVHYRVENRGNVALTSGSISIEIQSADSRRSVYAKKRAFSYGKNSFAPELTKIPKGRYVIVLKAHAENRQHGIVRDLVLAEKPLTISVPVEVREVSAAIPRVLILKGPSDASLRQAMAEKILQEALSEQDIYYHIVDGSDDFMNQAMIGMYNTYVLFEQEGMISNPAWLVQKVNQGHGLVLIGSNEWSRATAESMGFRFEEPIADNTKMLMVSQDVGMKLSGTIPVSGRLFPPAKKGARPLMHISDTTRTAALIDAAGQGSIVVMPFSVIQSARDAGTVSIYGLLMRTAIAAVVPHQDRPESRFSAKTLMVSAPTGPVQAKIVERLPPGSELIWTSSNASVRGRTITYGLQAEKQPKKLLYLYRPPKQSGIAVKREIYYNCKGRMVKAKTVR